MKSGLAGPPADGAGMRRQPLALGDGAKQNRLMAKDKGKPPRFVRVRRPAPERPEEQAETARTGSGGGAGRDGGPHPHRRPEAREDGRRRRRSRREADVELREVRFGATSRGPYLRVVPRQRRLKRVAPGLIEATPLGSRPQDMLGRYLADIKRVVIGSPFATSQAIHERLTKVKALAIFSSDALSSSAYATEEILIVLVLAGSGALHNALPIAAVIALLLVIVTLSYRQTIRAYPSGGGAYIVAHENLGRRPGLLAASALLVDYVLTVSVSVAAGVAAVTSAAPDLQDLRVPIGVAVVIV